MTRCLCRERLVDWRKKTVYHPYLACPHYGHVTSFDDTLPKVGDTAKVSS